MSLPSHAKFCANCGREQLPTPSEPAAQPNPKRRRRVLSCLGVLTLFVVLCCGLGTGAYFWLGFNQAGQTLAVAPAGTSATLTISPNILQLSQLANATNLADGASTIAAPLVAVPGVLDTLNSANGSLPLNQLAIDPVQDVLPWLGREVSVFVLPMEADSASPALLVSAVTRDPAGSDTFLANFRNQLEQADVPTRDDVYRDITYTTVGDPAGAPIAYTTLNDLVLVATSPAGLHQAIDQHLDQPPTLAQSPAYQQVMAALPTNRLGHLYLDEATLQAVLSNWPQGALPIAPTNMGIAFQLHGSGLRLHYAMQQDPNALTSDQLAWWQSPASDHTTLNQTPVSSFLTFSGNDLNLTWDAVQNAGLNADMQLFLQVSGLHPGDQLVRDTIGSYTVALVDDRDGFLNLEHIPFNALLLTQVNDTRLVMQDLEEVIDDFARARNYPFEQETSNQTRVWLLENQRENVTLGYGLLGETLALATSEDALDLATRTNNPLPNNELFQRTIRAQPDESHLLVYLDVQTAIRTFYPTLPATAQDEFDNTLRPLLTSIQAFSFATQPMADTGLTTGTIVITTP